MANLPPDSPIRALRELSGLSAIELADRLGVTRAAIYQAEERGSGVTVGYLLEVAAACGLSLRLETE